ncbi:hypothetical protein [Ekhidna sp.]|uniref:hypothetical protein n=1 Tax=Ekhidna sp. TaxID=2608089 RepID=UPI003CCBB1A7
MSNDITIVNQHLKFSKVTLKEPLTSGFILISAEVDKRTSFWGESSTKQQLLREIKSLTHELKKEPDVLEVTLFKASLFPPGRDGGYLQKLNKKLHNRFDVILLIELSSFSAIEKLKDNTVYHSIQETFDDLSSFHFIYHAENIRRIDTVNHQKKGVFLFNYFVAEDTNQNLDIWEYTAGWFQDQTGLDNSTLFSSVDDKPQEFSVINHCRWDSFMNIIPSLILKKTFKTYVLDNFEANNVAANPVLYKLA